MVTLPTLYCEDRRKAVTAAGRNRRSWFRSDDGYGLPCVRRGSSRPRDVVIAVVDAHRSIEDTTRWIEALDTVDAVALEAALDVSDPAAVLQLELPVIRLDGIAIDRIGWAAVLCAQLTAGPVPVGAEIDE